MITGFAAGSVGVKGRRLGRAGDRKFLRFPGVESANDIHHLYKSGALEKARADRTTVTALTVHRNGHARIEVREQSSQMVERF